MTKVTTSVILPFLKLLLNKMYRYHLQRTHIPLNDLGRHGNSVSTELHEATESVITSGHYVLGSWVERFERAFASYCGVQHTVGVANGTDALELALRAINCKTGDEVITVANAGGYATSAIIHVGATPIYADIDPQTFLITALTFEQVITPATKAIIVTHLYGLMADMPALCEAASSRGITVIEDCAQAHGASIAGKKAGSWGTLGCFSFYPTKNLGGIGDAGCIVTHDDGLAEKLRSLRQYGWQKTKYYSPEVLGRNSRMDEIQAAILLRLLTHLDGWNHKRRRIITRYREALNGNDIVFQQVYNDDNFVAHLCVIRTRARSRLMQILQHENIASDIHYPVADYAQPAIVRYIGEKPILPVTEQILSEILTIPCFPEMTEEEINRVITTIQCHISRVAA